jgi:hypothetical protein
VDVSLDRQLLDYFISLFLNLFYVIVSKDPVYRIHKEGVVFV